MSGNQKDFLRVISGLVFSMALISLAVIYIKACVLIWTQGRIGSGPITVIGIVAAITAGSGYLSWSLAKEDQL